MTKRQNEIGSLLIAVVFTIGMIAFLMILIENAPKKEEPEPDYRIETARGLEYPNL
tara:strand:+ start:8805 stop:8972 length:168 start_codon:yes stop_codon:yes gene_type:complete